MKDEDSAGAIRIGNRITIRPRGKRGTYQAEFWYNGQHRRRSLKTRNLKFARSRAIELERELEAGDCKPAPTQITFDDAVQKYLTFLEAEHRAPKTITRYRAELKMLAEFLATRGRRTLASFRLVDFDAWREQRSKARASKTVHHEGIVAKQFIGWCASRHLVATNVLADYRVPEPPHQPKPVPDFETVNAILAASSPEAGPLLITLAITGLRVGELQGLRRRDVDTKAGFIDVIQQLNGPTKTKRIRRVPIHPRIAALLRRQVRSGSHQLLFTAQPSVRYPSGGRPICPKRLNERFKAAARRCGRDDLTQHSLRRFFTTFTINAGVPERVVRLWLGHADRSTTGRYYALTDAESRRFMHGVPFGQPQPDQ